MSESRPRWRQRLAALRLLLYRHRGPEAAGRWERTWREGYWDFLGSGAEAARYELIAAYLGELKPAGSVLDLGCGDGRLALHLPAETQARYLGVDIAAQAIARARRRGLAGAAFQRQDIAAVQPGRRFDALVINEVLYYLPGDPVAQLADLSRRLLVPGGVLIVSMYVPNPRAWHLWRRLGRRFPILRDQTTGGRRGRAWRVAALAPGGGRPRSA